jgi:PncC family amidohydrolase
MSELSAIAIAVADLLKERGDSLAVAESSAGGLISASLVSIEGASKYYVGGTVSYTRGAGQNLLSISDEKLTGIQASTEPYALVNAREIKEKLGTTWGISETGATGPMGNRYGDAAGHACLAVVGPVEKSITIETGDTDREANMWAFAAAALNLLEDCLTAAK